jgi:N-acyl-D-amino-acid deacylase
MRTELALGNCERRSHLVDQGMQHDLLIRGGSILDGTGAPARLADIAIDGDTITSVEQGGSARREIDARGLLVTPGFVDVHTHYDAQVTWDPMLTPSSWHGVTTVVMGNCGVGFAPVRPEEHDFLIGLMEGVEDIPGAAMHEGIRWGWESFPQYLDALDRMPRVIDVGAQVPHGPLRAYVMGKRGARNEPATPQDIDAMRRLVREGLEAGALGFSTSRTLLHRAVDGEPVPGTFAARDELLGIGEALRETGRGVFQMAGEHTEMGTELGWIEELAARTGRPVLFNLSQVDQAPDLWRQILGRIDDAAARGLPIRGQVAGRAIGIIMSLELTAHPFLGYPTWQGLMTLPAAERISALRTPEVRARLLAERPAPLGPFGDFVTRSFDRMFPFREAADYEPSADSSVASIAARARISPQEVALTALLAGDMLYFPLFNWANRSLDLLHELHQHPHTVMGLSDAGAHCGAICDGGMPTFMLTHWARDRRGPRLSLEHIVQRQTRDTARAFGLTDRGVLAPGMKADVNVIDFDRLSLLRPEIAHDLPAGGRRLIQRARGYVSIVKSGVEIVSGDEPTGALPGKLIRATANC